MSVNYGHLTNKGITLCWLLSSAKKCTKKHEKKLMFQVSQCTPALGHVLRPVDIVRSLLGRRKIGAL
jgi:D-lyxose ketol-isomerase